MGKPDAPTVVVTAVLLPASFPVREIWDKTACNILRLTGLMLLIRCLARKVLPRRRRDESEKP